MADDNNPKNLSEGIRLTPATFGIILGALSVFGTLWKATEYISTQNYRITRLEEFNLQRTDDITKLIAKLDVQQNKLTELTISINQLQYQLSQQLIQKKGTGDVSK